MGIVHSLPNEWRLLLKALRVNSIPSPSSYISNRDPADAFIRSDGNSLVDIQQLTSKKVYEALIAMKTKEPSAKVKFTKLFPDENLDWKTIYKIPFLTTIDTKTRTFRFKLLHTRNFVH